MIASQSISMPSAGRTAGRLAWLCAALVLATFLAAQDAQSQTLLADDLTSVVVTSKLPYLVTSLGSPHITVGGETNEDTWTSFEFVGHSAANWTPADLLASGDADFGMLSASLALSGGSAIEARIGSIFHDVYTLATPVGVAQGTPGTVAFVYIVDGEADVEGLPNDTPDSEFAVVTAMLSMTRYLPDGNVPPNLIIDPLGSDSFGEIASQSLDGSDPNTASFDVRRYVSIDVPFQYGVPIALRTTLGIVALTDNTFFQALFNPYREQWGGGVVQSIEASSTAELVAIVNELHPEASVTGVSLDYSALVTDTTPVPEPSAQVLGVVAVSVVFALGRRRSSSCSAKRPV